MRARRSGAVTSSRRLSQAYGFTDLDGRQPNIWPAAEAHFARAKAAPHAAYQWRLAAD
ncbi:MAG TPA: hypothetical protein VK002_07895 [Rubricoccaceae bacterium]|nr:hypothetical protein [Rubricoccaceae bacterium]